MLIALTERGEFPRRIAISVLAAWICFSPGAVAQQPPTMPMAYQGLSGGNLAKLAIGLRTPDYGQQLAAMLKVIQDALSGNLHYLGWAWHSYNDVAQLSH
jgi:hypothetical protein